MNPAIQFTPKMASTLQKALISEISLKIAMYLGQNFLKNIKKGKKICLDLAFCSDKFNLLDKTSRSVFNRTILKIKLSWPPKKLKIVL